MPKPKKEDSKLVEVAKKIGHAAGVIAVETGIEPAPEKPKTAAAPKIGKLPPKNKHRLPRREKKALQKSTASRV